METEHVWQKIVALKPKGYLEIQNYEEGLVYHGPVESVSIDETDSVHIKLKWVAQMPLRGRVEFGSWEKAPDQALETAFPNFVVPYVIQSTEKDDPVLFGGLNIIYIDDEPGFGPERVKGLNL